MFLTTLEFLFLMRSRFTTDHTMRLLYVIGFVTLYMTINSDANQELTHNKNTPILDNDPKDIESLELVADLARNFSSYFFQKVTAFVPHDRVASSQGIFHTLSMLSYGAQGPAKRNLLNAIGLPKDKTEMAQIGYKSYWDKLAEHGFQMKTRIFTPPGVNLNPQFLNLSRNVFRSDNDSVNLTDGFLDSQRINEWVAAQTHDNVTKLFKPQFIGLNPNILIASTVYFDGTWEIPFDRSRTEPSPFRTLYGESIDLDTMHTNGRFCVGRFEELKASFIKLSYKGRAMSMFVLLPDKAEHNEWVYFVYGLRTIKLSMFSNCTEKEVEVSMPKFKIQTAMSINNVLKEVMQPELSLTGDRINKPLSIPSFREQLFLSLKLSDPVEVERSRPERANFSGIFKSSERSRLGKTAMKFAIDVNEGGQLAAGSNGVSYRKVISPSLGRQARSTITELPLQFKVDHPFVALVMTDGNLPIDVLSVYFVGEGNKLKKRRSHQRNKKQQRTDGLLNFLYE